MHSGFWKHGGPTILGYQPGWLWWAAAVVIVVGSAYILQDEVGKRQRSRAYIDARIAHHAAEQGLDPALVRAVVKAESNYDQRAESAVGAKGLMQVMPLTLEDVRQRFDVGGGDLYDIDYNLRVGTLYLGYLLERFEGDLTLALAGYHMGPTRVSRAMSRSPGLASRELVNKHGGPQTRAYVQKVLDLYEET